MKLFFTILFSTLFLTGFAQIDCQPFMPTEEGSTWEQTHYSKNDKMTGRTRFELLKKTASGDSLILEIKSVSLDEKDAEIYVSEFEAYCINGVFEMDMASKLNGATMAAYESMDVTVDASRFPIPTLDEAVGTRIGDGTLVVQVSMNGMNTFRMTVEITDRLVAARENLETTAGTFDCVKISQTINTKMVMKMQSTSNEWYAEGIGVVRSESFDKKGRLTGYSVLTAVDLK